MLRRFCVDSVDKEKKWSSDVVHLLFIDALFQLGATEARISRGTLEYSLFPCSGLTASRFLLVCEHCLDGFFTPLVYCRSIQRATSG